MKLFPHIISRIGGSAFSHLEAISSPALRAHSAAYATALSRRAAAAERVCAGLQAYNSTLPGSGQQNKIQNLRRDIHNHRPGATGKAAALRHLLPALLQQQLQDYEDCQQQVFRTKTQGQFVYEQEVLRLRQQLQGLGRQDSLQLGLSLSSQTFLKSLTSYLDQAPATFRKKEFYTEGTLLKYLMRLHAKTSPFSTFTNLATAQLVPGAAAAVEVGCPEAEVRSHVLLNNYLFLHIQNIIVHHEELRKCFRITPNPTLLLEHRTYAFMINFNNVEAFQRLPATGLLTYILQVLEAQPATAVLADLLDSLLLVVDSSPAELSDYVLKLLKSGFLELDFSTSGLNPAWHLVLADYLAQNAHKLSPEARELESLLRALQVLMDQFGRAKAPGRMVLLHQAWTMAKNFFEKFSMAVPATSQVLAEVGEAVTSPPVEPSAPPSAQEPKREFLVPQLESFLLRPEQMFYEDTTRPVALGLHEQALTSIIGSLHSLCEELFFFHTDVGATEAARSFFLAHYEPTAQVNILNFYEAYSRGKEGMDAPTSDSASAGADQAVLTKKMLQNRWADAFADFLASEPLSTEHDFHLSLEQIRAVNQTVGIAAQPITSSLGGFFQVFEQRDAAGSGHMMAVINRCFPGYGKVISRFLHIVDEQITDDVRRYNEPRKEEVLYIENSDGSYFNVNIHPALLSHEIAVPGGNNNLPPAQRLPIREFVIRFVAAQNKLLLIHEPSGRPARLFNLGLQDRTNRSQLFQLLECFTDAIDIHPESILHLISNAFHNIQSSVVGSKRVITLPRIILDGHLVLHRRSWLVAKELLPVRHPLHSDDDYFFHVNTWRKEHDIADHVFININPYHLESTAVGNGHAPVLSRDDRKPQYMDFTNPLLVHLLEKLIAKAETFIKIEEMLPGPAELLTIGQEQFVTEHAIQWYE